MARKRPKEMKSDRGATVPTPPNNPAAVVCPEELTLDERDALSEKIEAARQRGRPPSI